MSLRWFDAGVNLTHSKFSTSVEAYLERASAAGVERLLVIGTDLEQSKAALALCERFPQQLIASVGIHPHDAEAAPRDAMVRLRDLAQHQAVRAIGECGLDFNRNYSSTTAQLTVFEDQLKLAADLQLPVYLHERDAKAQQLQLLQTYRSAIPRMLTHCFTGNIDDLNDYLALDCYIGITGWICDERRGQDLQQAVSHIPEQRLLLETDAPFLLPRSIRPRPKYNESCWLPHIAEQVAQLRQQSTADLAAQSWQNSIRFFARQ